MNSRVEIHVLRTKRPSSRAAVANQYEVGRDADAAVAGLPDGTPCSTGTVE